jgi:hypothetical protein
MTDRFQAKLAPDQLWQAINPWNFYNPGAQFGLVDINLGATPQVAAIRKIKARERGEEKGAASAGV